MDQRSNIETSVLTEDWAMGNIEILREMNKSMSQCEVNVPNPELDGKENQHSNAGINTLKKIWLRSSTSS